MGKVGRDRASYAYFILISVARAYSSCPPPTALRGQNLLHQTSSCNNHFSLVLLYFVIVDATLYEEISQWKNNRSKVSRISFDILSEIGMFTIVNIEFQFFLKD